MRKKITTASRILIFFCFFLGRNAIAQFSPDTAVLNKSVANAVDVYHSSQQGLSSIYNGAQHIWYPSSIEGFAYFLTSEWQKGSISYEGIVHNDIFLLYDVVRDEVIVQHPTRMPVVPYVVNVNGFSFSDHVFVRMDKTTTPSLKTGFYEQITRGDITILIKREKVIEEKINGIQLERKFIKRDKYYIVKDSVYYPVGSEKDILKVLKDSRNEIRQHLADSNIRFKTDPDAAIIEAVEYYNQLSNH